MTTNGNDIREFLISRRARISPESVGLAPGGNRRVPGLRRSEVANLAGVSVEYYARIERGALRGVSNEVLTSIADALRLNDAERSHLFDLGSQTNLSPVRARRQSAGKLHPSVQWALDAMLASPAFVRNARLDVIADNALFRTLYDVAYRTPGRPLNMARFCFLHQDVSRSYYADWDASADVNVEILRTEAGRHPHDKALQDLIGELSTCSDEFRRRWGSHNVRHHASREKVIHHPNVGTLDLVYNTLDIVGSNTLNMVIYSAAPGSAAEQSLQLLATLSATAENPHFEGSKGAIPAARPSHD